MRLTLGLLALPALFALGALSTQAVEPDPWQGKAREDVVELLGPPDRIKQSLQGDRLTYKLVRLDEAGPFPDDMRILQVPGVKGLLGTRTPVEDPGGDLEVRPMEVDERGRTSGGVVEAEESHSVSWSTEDGGATPRPEQSAAVQGKVTLKFRLDAAGRVTSWSVSPKKAASGKPG